MQYPELLVRGCLLSLLLSLSGLVTAQASYLIRGVVVDSVAQEPLFGAAVRIAGTDTGTVADYDGRFALEVDTPVVSLLVDYTGYETKTLRVQLPLAEAIVIELGIDPLGAACVWVMPKPLDAHPPGYYPHPGLSLRGRVPGLLVAQAGHDPWAVPELRAQGVHTLLQNAQPLWVIDGLPGADPLLYDGLELADLSLVQSPVDLLPYGLQAGSGVLRATVSWPTRSRGWAHHYRTQATFASPQRLPEVATAEAYRRRWPGRADLGFATDWLSEVTRNSWSHDHHWRSAYTSKEWQLQGDMTYRNAQGVGRNSDWQQVGGRLSLRRSFYQDRLRLSGQAIANRRWGERDYHETFFQAAKYNPTAPIRFTEPPQGDVFLEGMYAFSQASLNNFFEVVSSVDIFNPVALQAANRLLETRVNQAAQASLQWDFSAAGQFEIRLATQANDYLAGEENSIQAYFRGRATTLRPGAAGRWAWKRRQELVQTKVSHQWRLGHRGKLEAEGRYRFQRFQFGNEASRGRGFADNDFTYRNFAARLLPESSFAQYQRAETHRLIDFLAATTYTHRAGWKWRTALLYQGSTRLGNDERWQPLVATDLELELGKLLKMPQLRRLHLQTGYGMVGSLPQNEEAYQGQYYSGNVLPQINNRQLGAEQRRLWHLGLVRQSFYSNFSLHYQHSQTTELIASRLQLLEANLTEAVGVNLTQTRLVNASVQGRFTYERQLSARLRWASELQAMYVRTRLRATGEAGPAGFFNNQGDYIVETARLREQNGGLGIAVLRQDEAFGQLLGRQYDLAASRAAGQFVLAEPFSGNALAPGSTYGVVGNGLPTLSGSWRNRLTLDQHWTLDFQLRADLGHELAHLRRGELAYTIDQETIFPSSRNYLSTEYDLEGVTGFPAFTDYYVEHANYLSLDYVSVSYQLHRKHRPFCTFSLTGQNLALWTNYTGVDPSPRFVDTGLAWNGNLPVLGAAGQLAPGIDRRAFYPRALMVSLGVELVL